MREIFRIVGRFTDMEKTQTESAGYNYKDQSDETGNARSYPLYSYKSLFENVFGDVCKIKVTLQTSLLYLLPLTERSGSV